MSPLPFRTTTLIAHGAGSVAAAAAASDAFGGEPDRAARTTASVAARTSAPAAATAASRRSGFGGRGGVGRPASSSASRWSTPCAVARREAVEAPLLEPLHLVRLDVGAARGFLDRQLALQARVRERRLVGRNDGFERAYGLH